MIDRRFRAQLRHVAERPGPGPKAEVEVEVEAEAEVVSEAGKARRRLSAATSLITRQWQWKR